MGWRRSDRRPLGIFLAYQLYCARDNGARNSFAKVAAILYQLLSPQMYVGRNYDAAIVDRTKDLGTGLVAGRNVIDGLGVKTGAGWLARFSSTSSMWWDKLDHDGC